MDGGYVYATVNKKKKNTDETETINCLYSTAHVETSFDPQIPTTLPVSLAELSDYVECCHDDSNKAFYSQFEVYTWYITATRQHCSKPHAHCTYDTSTGATQWRH